MTSSPTTKYFAIIILAAYLLTLFGSPAASYADEKSSKAKADVERWHPRNRETGLDGETKAMLVMAGALVAVAVIALIVKAAGKHDGGEEQEEKAQQQPDEQICIGDSSGILSVQTELRKNQQKSLPHLLGRKPLIPSKIKEKP